MDSEGKLGEAEIRLKEVADLKEAVAENEDKFYDMGFAEAENSSEPIMLESRQYRFGEEWMAAVNALGLPEDSPLRDLEQIPYLEPPPPLPVQDPAQNEKEDSLSIRGLVEKIDSYAEVIELDILSNSIARQDQTPLSHLLNPNPRTTIDAHPRPSKHVQDPKA